jgi:hypothetical protein
LPQVVGATGTLCLVFCLTESREQQPGEDGNDCDYNQKLDQGERLLGVQSGFHRKGEATDTAAPRQVNRISPQTSVRLAKRGYCI